jgi:WD40 repeat protein
MLTEYTDIEVKKIRGNGFITLSRYDKNAKNLYICDQESEVIRKINTYDYKLNKTYNGHNGIIWDIALSENDIMISASGDMSYIVWEISSGNIILKKDMMGIPKIVKFNELYSSAAIYIESFGKNKKKILILENITKENLLSENYTTKEFIVENTVSAMEWIENKLVVGFQNGLINVINVLTGDIEKENKLHNDSIKMFDKSSKFENIWLSASADGTAKEFNINTFEILHTYEHGFPINIARYNHNNRKIYLGGGLEAMEVAKNNNNDLTLKIFKRGGKMTNIINGHFGPIRDLNFAKVNSNFMTASQDGTVIVYLISENNTEKEEEEEKGKEEIIENKKIITSKEQLINDIFGETKNNSNEKKGEIRNDFIKMKNLNFVSQKVNNLNQKYIPGMQKPNHMIEQEKFENDLKEKQSGKLDDRYGSGQFGDKKKIYGIKIFGLEYGTSEKYIREVFENFGKIHIDRGIKLISSDKEFSKVDGKRQQYRDLMVIINYTSKESADRAVNIMDKTAFNNVLLNIQHCE